MSYTVVIPARYGSTRLPGKPLLDIHGKSLVQRVWERACRSNAQDIIIATDDERIQAAAEAFGAKSCLTRPEHASGTDRIAEVVRLLNLPADHIVVNVQGDEPMIPTEVIDQVATNLREHQAASIATLCARITDIDDLKNPNVVKVVRDINENALYFSRAPIPFPRDAFLHNADLMPDRGDWYRHIGIYAYRGDFLSRFVDWPPAPLEQLECLEQLRALHQGARIHVDEACRAVPPGVDTEADLAHIRQLLERER